MPLDSQVRKLLDAFKAQGLKGFEEMTVPEAREAAMAFLGLQGDRVPVAATSDHLIPVRAGEIAARLYRPSSQAASQPVVIYFHGGGFVFGDIELIDKVARSLCVASQAAVLTVSYRKAPEHRFPTAAEDCYAALSWLAEHAPQLGVDRSRVAVAGDSAGGCLAAVVCQMARDRGGPSICYQLLVYPVTDAGGSYPSRQQNAEGYLLTSKAMDWFFGHYLNGPDDVENPYCSPIRGDFEGLPPATVITAGYDPLRDEGDAYAAALKTSGVPVEHVRNPSMIHAFFWMKGVLQHAATVHAEVGLQLQRVFKRS